MAPRRNLSKGARFDVFKRDGFTCQYCGRRPPDVVLECDHIHPVAAGGSNDIDNLVTACADCNAGKRDRRLEERVIRPDAELMFLEAQQDIAELRRYQEAAAEREYVLGEIVGGLQGLWEETAGLDWSPSDAVLRQMLARYEPAIVEHAVIDVAAKVGGGYLSEHGTKWLRYLWAVARNMATEER